MVIFSFDVVAEVKTRLAVFTPLEPGLKISVTVVVFPGTNANDVKSN